MKRTLLTLALIATAGAAHAQSMAPSEPRDPFGNPFIGRNDWVRQPGDQGYGASGGANMAVAPPSRSAEMPAASTGPREATFKDEYGFRYDAQGNRLDARGNIISPQTR